VSTLAALQREFMAALFAQPAPGLRGIEVYRRNVLANLHGALALSHPVTRRLVGDAFFREASDVFAREFPSTSGDLNAFGDRFAQFIAAYPHARQLPYLADVARLEWACHESYGAADSPRFEFDALARVPPPLLGAIRFVLAPSVRLLRSAHPIAAIWEANQPGRDGLPLRTQGPDCVVVHRDAAAVRVAVLPRVEWELLERIAEGASLEEALAGIGDDEPGVLPAALARFVAEGIVSGFKRPAGEA
jgi:hypothetical protein